MVGLVDYLHAYLKIVVTTCPLWVITTRMKATRDTSLEDEGMIKGMIKIAKEEGISSLWSGALASIVLVTNPMINYTVL